MNNFLSKSSIKTYIYAKFLGLYHFLINKYGKYTI
jgi:hypothetical protein